MTDDSPTTGENKKAFTVIAAQWPRDREKIFAVRHEVFVVEQSIDPELEWTGDDAQFQAVLAVDAQSVPIGTGRISATGEIGRMAVLKNWRGCGVGSAILQRLIEMGRQSGLSAVKLSAQLHAVDFYQQHGFEAQGDVYLDAGIEHRAMTRRV